MDALFGSHTHCHGIHIDSGEGHDDDDDPLDWEEWDPEKGSYIHHCIAGSIAGVAEHTCMFPIDTIKTHTQCMRCNTTTTPFKRAAMDLVAREGYFRLWRGVQTMMGACIPAHAAYFSIFEMMKERLGANDGGHRPLQAGAAGAVATVAHDSIMTPMDVCKQRLQLG